MFIKGLILVAGTVLLLSVTGILFFTKKLKAGWTAAILVLLFAGLVAVITVPALREYMNIPTGTAQTATDAYCGAIVSNPEEGTPYLLESGRFGREEEPANPITAVFYDALVSGVRVSRMGEAEMGWLYAKQNVTVTCPNVTALAERVSEKATVVMENIGSVRPRSLVYNSDKSYQPKVADEAVLAAVQGLDFSGCEQLSANTTLTLECVNGEWKIRSDAPVYEAVSALFGGRSVTEGLDSFVADLCEAVRTQTPYVDKHFTIAMEETVAPEPDHNRYGTTTDPAVVSAVVAKAADLLDGQPTVWTPETPIYPGTEIRYYFDDSILAIVWREEKNGTLCTFAEIKIADASQLRRKLVDDMYDPPQADWIEATKLSEQVNAVVATGSDLYAFRRFGIFSYDGELYRCMTNAVESCHITYSGDMLFTKRYELADWDEAQQWITDNDVMFSMSFGPALIVDGVPAVVWDYPIGEIWEGYSRAAMGQLGEKGSLHYLMTVMASDERVSVPELPVLREPILQELENVMIEKGCTQAYTLDGGQTGAIIIDNQMLTRPTYGWERIYCDILYFATAIPPEERLG